MEEPVKKYVRDSPHCDTHIIFIVVQLLQMKKQILNTKHIVVYPVGGDARNFCAGVHYNTLQEFIKEQHTHLVIYNDINDDLAQGIMIITMLLNDSSKGIDNSSLYPRV